jgi:hypothetical protein
VLSHRRRFALLFVIVVGLPATIAASAPAQSNAHLRNHNGRQSRQRRGAHRARTHCPAGTHRRHRRGKARCTARVVAHRGVSSVSASRNSSHHVKGSAPVLSLAPGISGAAVEGQTLSASAGSWTGATPMSYAYQWQHDGANISGANASTYALGSRDVGYQMDVVVSASNSLGSNSAVSALTADVTAIAVAAGGGSPPPATPPPPAPTPSWEGIPAESWEGFSAANPMPGGRTPGSSNSPFNERIVSPQVLSNSSAMVAWLLSHHESGSPAIGDHTRPGGSGHPLVYATNTDPIVELVATEAWGPNPLQGRKIRVPAGAVAEPALPGDAHLEIVLAPTDARVPGETVELWRAAPVVSGKLVFSWGGPGNIAGTLLDNAAADAANFDLSAGQVRAAELKAGVVPHALVANVFQTKPTYVYPASHTDGSSNEAAAPAMGQRFYLAYSDSEIEALPVAPWKKAVLKALADYGFYVTDTGNYTTSFEFEGSSTYTAFGAPEPFSAVGKEQGLPTDSAGGYIFKLSEGVDWTRLRAIAPPA